MARRRQAAGLRHPGALHRRDAGTGPSTTAPSTSGWRSPTRASTTPAATSRRRSPGSLHAPFYAWLHKRYWSGTHQVAVLWASEPGLGWRRIAPEPYRDARFAARGVDVYERVEPLADGAGCKAAP